MDQWLLDIEQEKRRAAQASEAHNEGRLRTSARRIAGIALVEYRRLAAGAPGTENFLVLLQDCANDPTKPDAVRDAARRLQARVGEDFTSSSADPLGDAEVIVKFVRSAAQNS
jgi:hypothetical protein